MQNIYRISFIIFKIKKSKDNEIYERKLLASEELEELEGLNVDLRSRKGETYRCKVAAEGCRFFLVQPG